MFKVLTFLLPFLVYSQTSDKTCAEIPVLREKIELTDSGSLSTSLNLKKKLYALLKKCDLENSKVYQHDLALAFLRSGQKDSALYYSEQALKYSEKSRNDSLRIRVSTTLGMLYNQEGAYDAALRNYREVYLYYKAKTEDPTKRAVSAINLAQTFIRLNDKEQALFYLEEATEFGNKSTNRALKSYIYGISYDFYKLTDKEKALSNLRQSVNEALSVNNYARAIEGAALLVKADQSSNAESQYILLIENHIQSVANLSLLKNLYVLLSSYYLNEKSLPKAKKYNRLKDSVYEVLYQNRNLVEIAKLDSINNSIKARNLDLENAVLKKEKRNQLLLLLLLTTILVSLLIQAVVQRFNYKLRIQTQGSKEKEISQLLLLNSKTDASKKQQETFKKTLEFLASNKTFKEPNLKVKDLAKLIGVSPRHLSNAINNCYQNNFSALINRFRVEEAKKILVEMSKNTSNQYSLDYVWEQCGFSNDVSFYRTFKNITSLTPTEYLRNNR